MRDPIHATKKWLEKTVISLNLCPFAHRVLEEGKIRFVLSRAEGMSGIIEEFVLECHHLLKDAHSSTSLIVIPYLDKDFEYFLDVLEHCENYLEKTQMDIHFQLASFHPKYQFEGTEEMDRSNYTNRSPHAVIHILSVHEVTTAIEAYPDTTLIPENNIRTLSALDDKTWNQHFDYKT